MKGATAFLCACAVGLLAASIVEARAGGHAEPTICSTTPATASVYPLAVFDARAYRPLDPRVERLERGGYRESGLFEPGAETHTRPIQAEVSRALEQLSPGGQLVIADGEWRDTDLTVAASGTWDRPILVRPRSPHGVTFVGKTRLRIVGANIIVSDLAIRDGNYPSTVTVLGLGNSEQPCDGCVAIDLSMANLSAGSTRLHYLGARGRDITVAYSRFGGARSPGHYVYDSHPTERGEAAQLHLVHNVFYDRRAVSDENGYELLQMGESSVQAQAMYGRIEDNLFRDSMVPHADTELITIKSSDWLIRNNTFQNTLGDLTLRSTNRVLVEGNRFIGGGPTSASGVRVHGGGHVIVRNYFFRNANPLPATIPNGSAYYYSVVVPSGTVEDVRDGEAGVPAAKNVIIADNVLVGGLYNVQLGSFFPHYPILPRGVVFTNNRIYTDQALPLFVLPQRGEALYLCQNTLDGNFLAGPTGLTGLLPPDRNASVALPTPMPSESQLVPTRTSVFELITSP